MSFKLTQKTPDTIWWEFVTGPSRLVLETADILRAGKSVCLCVKGVLPFRDAFFQLVADSLRETDGALLLDDVLSATHPGMALIERFGLRAEYREAMQTADFLRKHHAMIDRLVPVVAQGDDVRRWIEFIYAYKSASIQDGLFLLEANTHLSPLGNRHRNAVQVLEYDDLISEYDSLTYAGLIADSADATVEQRRYAAALAVSLFGKDAQAILSFIQQYTLEKAPEDILPKDAVSDEAVARCLWNAQVQELFPLIMRMTRRFVEQWQREISEAFEYVQAARDYPNSLFINGLRNSYDEPVNSPEELEIATIFYLMRKRRRDRCGFDTADYVLYVPDERAREWIGLLYRMRNCIAHGKVCPVADVVQLLC